MKGTLYIKCEICQDSKLNLDLSPTMCHFPFNLFQFSMQFLTQCNILNTFPNTTNYAADDFEYVYKQIWELSTYESVITEKSCRKQYGKRRNCYHDEQFLLLPQCFQMLSAANASLFSGKGLSLFSINKLAADTKTLKTIENNGKAV